MIQIRRFESEMFEMKRHAGDLYCVWANFTVMELFFIVKWKYSRNKQMDKLKVRVSL